MARAQIHVFRGSYHRILNEKQFRVRQNKTHATNGYRAYLIRGWDPDGNVRTIYIVETLVSRENDLESKDRRAVRDTMVEDAKHSEEIVHR